MLVVAASVLAVVCKQMQQLQAMLGPAVHRGKGMTYKTSETMCNASAWLQQCWESCANGSKIVALRVQTDATCIIQQCWELLVRKVVSFCPGLYLAEKKEKTGNWLKQARRLPRDFQPIVCNAQECKEDTSIACRQKTKKQVKILPYGALTWQVKVVTDQFSLKPRANGRTTLFANNSQH